MIWFPKKLFSQVTD